MAPFYKYAYFELGLVIDEKLFNSMEEENSLIFGKLDENIEYARSEEGDLELRNCIIEKAHYMAVIGIELVFIYLSLNLTFLGCYLKCFR